MFVLWQCSVCQVISHPVTSEHRCLRCLKKIGPRLFPSDARVPVFLLWRDQNFAVTYFPVHETDFSKLAFIEIWGMAYALHGLYSIERWEGRHIFEQFGRRRRIVNFCLVTCSFTSNLHMICRVFASLFARVGMIECVQRKVYVRWMVIVFSILIKLSGKVDCVRFSWFHMN